MTIAAAVGQAGKTTDNAFDTTGKTYVFPVPVLLGSLIVITCERQTDASTAWVSGDCTKSAGTATIDGFVLDKTVGLNVQGSDYNHSGIWSALVTGAGTLTIQVASSSGTFRGFMITANEYTGSFDSSRLEASNSGGSATDAQTALSSGNATSAGAALFVGTMCDYTANNTAIGQDGAFTVVAEQEDGSFLRGSTIYRIVSSGTTDAAEWTVDSGNSGWTAAVAVYKEAAAGGSSPVPGMLLLGVG